MRDFGDPRDAAPLYGDDVRQRVEKLLFTIWITKGARFNAARRLERTAELSNLAALFLSFSITCLSLVTLLYAEQFDAFQNKTIGAATVMISFFIMLMSLIQSGKNHRLRAYVLHRCGIELTELHREIEIRVATERLHNQDFVAMNRAYSDVIGKNLENHENLDYTYFQCLNPHKFEQYFRNHNRTQIYLQRLCYRIDPYLAALAPVIFPALILVAAAWVLTTAT